MFDHHFWAYAKHRFRKASKPDLLFVSNCHLMVLRQADMKLAENVSVRLPIELSLEGAKQKT